MRTGIRYPALPFLAAGLQVGAGVVSRSGFADAAVLSSHALVAAWLVVNAVNQAGWRRAGVVLASAGWLMNLAVMLPNGGMPVSMAAVASIKGADHGVDPTDGHLAKHVALDDDTVLAPLADVHPLPALDLVYSAGDVLLALGLVVVLLSVAFASTSATRSRNPGQPLSWPRRVSTSG
jgi:hypothetical protein